MTNIKYTFEVLDGYLMDNNSVNVDSLAENIEVVCENDRSESAYNQMKNTRVPAAKVAVNWVCTWINAEIRWCYGHCGYVCTWEQVKKFNRLHNNSIDDVLAVLTAYITEQREILAEG